MGAQIRFLLVNAWKGLFRTEGIGGVAILLGLLGMIYFFLSNTFLLFKDWQQSVLLQTTGPNSDLSAVQGSAMVLFVLGVLNLLLTILVLASFLLLIGYLRRSFVQFAYIQRKDFKTMSLIGGTPNMISLEFALQPFILAIFILLVTGVGVDLLFQAKIAPQISRLDLITNHLLPVFFCGGYGALRSYIHTRRYLLSLVDYRQRVKFNWPKQKSAPQDTF